MTKKQKFGMPIWLFVFSVLPSAIKIAVAIPLLLIIFLITFHISEFLHGFVEHRERGKYCHEIYIGFPKETVRKMAKERGFIETESSYSDIDDIFSDIRFSDDTDIEVLFYNDRKAIRYNWIRFWRIYYIENIVVWKECHSGYEPFFGRI